MCVNFGFYRSVSLIGFLYFVAFARTFRVNKTDGVSCSNKPTARSNGFSDSHAAVVLDRSIAEGKLRKRLHDWVINYDHMLN